MSQGLSASQLAMWKAVIALIYADGKKHPDEEQSLRERFVKLKASDKQKQELNELLANPPSDVQSHFTQITAPQDRSQFIYYARLLFWSDGDFDQQEKEVLNLLNTKVMDQTDLKKVVHDLDKVVEDFKTWDESRRDNQPIHRKIINALIFWQDLDSLE